MDEKSKYVHFPNARLPPILQLRDKIEGFFTQSNSFHLSSWNLLGVFQEHEASLIGISIYSGK